MATKPKTTAKPASRSVAAKKTTVPDTAVETTTEVAETRGVTRVRRKEMVDRIVASTGKKPNEVKSVLDGVLEELGKALSAGESLNLPPLGKVSVNRQKKFDDREVIICKLRRKVEPDVTDAGYKTAAE